MIEIYFCEDNENLLKQYVNAARNYQNYHDDELLISCATTNPYKLLRKLNNLQGIGLYFLDIDLKTDINGFELLLKPATILIPLSFIPFQA